jgi:hypothetical protein
MKSKTHPYVVGRKYLIRTLTFYYTGHLEAVYAGEVVISSASWIPDSGRFGDFVNTGVPAECEPFPDAAQVVINRAAIVDCMPWVHDLPRTQK